MIRNYIKTAWRSLLKNKFYSAVNIAGLTVGLAIGILILLWVQDELSFDTFHKQSDNIYRMELFGGTGASRQIWQVGVAPMAPLAKAELPEVQDAVRITENYNFSLFKYQEKVFGDEKMVYADPSFFSVFDFPLISGNQVKPFSNDNSVVITQKTAKKFFGENDPIGKVIVADSKQNLVVSGVIADMPKNSRFNYDMIMPISYHLKDMLTNNHIDMSNNFSYFSYETYLLLKPGASAKALTAKLTQLHLKHKPDDTDAEYLLLPLNKMHLYNADMTNNGATTVKIFIVIGVLILLIACINYVNLSTARSMLRAKEISMRKIIGAGKMQLFFQFIVETALLFSFAALLSFGLVYLLMPVFNQLSGKELVLNFLDSRIWLVLLGSVLGTLVLSSIYPALLLSSFEPLKALKGKISTGIGDALFRKILVVTQFSISVILIVSTLVITSQLRYIRSRDLGYDKTNVFGFWMRNMSDHYEAVKSELLRQPGVLAVTRSNQNIIDNGNITGDVDWFGKDPKQNLLLHPFNVDEDMISFFKMKLVAGSSFTGSVGDTAHYILNEAAIKEMGLKKPIGKSFRMNRTIGIIVGVVKDFHYASMKKKIEPALFQYAPQFLRVMYVKTTNRDAQKTIAAAQKYFKQYNGEYQFNYIFLDDMFNKLYQSEQQESTLFNYFAAIAIFISCLVLLGLAAYTAQVRTREIGVRKVLGATSGLIITLLAKDFIKLVLIAIVIAIPVSWFAMDKWLQSFAYRAAVGWWVFIVAGSVAIVIAFATISLQSLKAALTNPVKSLRSE